MCWIWFEHYAFFRKFEAEDPLTILLNCVLLFLVLFFVYPLKFVFMLVGLTSVVLALTVPIQWIWTAGVIYALQGPLHWRNGVLIERARAKAFPSSMPARR